MPSTERFGGFFCLFFKKKTLKRLLKDFSITALQVYFALKTAQVMVVLAGASSFTKGKLDQLSK
ncbi:hypothetical protein I858_003315 [Planococcus versutus]|uniref:Uncharacterized protein n=1 Tax=Planococcus versutus TaxID=1302659 RepID=A0A1B1RYR8_9BACL|nr:hypothetical protein I858_003315 [Planococcus versutus]